jgi:site-specific recombinase XerD
MVTSHNSRCRPNNLFLGGRLYFMNMQHAIDDFLHYLEIEKNASPETIRAYAFDLHCFMRFLKGSKRSLELSDLKTATVRRYIQDQVINHNCKARTMHRRISCLKSFSKYCCKEQWITEDFMTGIQAPKLDKKLPVYMKLSELQKFLWFFRTYPL